MKHPGASKIVVAALAVSLLWIACSQSHERYGYQNQKEADKNSTPTPADVNAPPPPPPAKDEDKGKNGGPSNGFMSSSAAVENKKDTVHKFIRTADIKFRTKNVIKTTYKIEDIVAKFDGFVTYTNLNSSMDNKTTIAVSKDSSLETLYYTVQNDMTIRVPNTKLDTTLKEIALLMDYLDFRIIKADDVGLQMLANRLSEQRLGKHEERLTHDIDTKGKKLNETTGAEENLLEKQQAEDNARLQNLSLNDQINYSTVHLSIYQRQAIQRELVANEQNIEAYQPGLGVKVKEAIKEGWGILEAIIILLFDIWPFIVIALVGYIIYRKYRHLLKK